MSPSMVVQVGATRISGTTGRTPRPWRTIICPDAAAHSLPSSKLMGLDWFVIILPRVYRYLGVA